MSFSPKFLLWLFLPAAAAVGADTSIASDQPIVNFRLPAFNAEGFRAWMARGSEARPAAGGQFDVTELTLTVFSSKADEKIDTVILSPSARINPSAETVVGASTIRVINDEFEATGTDWSFAYKDKKVSIARHVRVTFRAELKPILK